MKNYYDQQMELNTTLFRIETLNEKKAIYFNDTQPKSPKYGEKVSSSHKPHDSFLEYSDKTKEIDEELEQLYQEKEILEKYLKMMEESLRKMKGILEKIFVAKYIDGLDVRRISLKFNYSESHIYRLLTTIHQIIKDDKK